MQIPTHRVSQHVVREVVASVKSSLTIDPLCGCSKEEEKVLLLVEVDDRQCSEAVREMFARLCVRLLDRGYTVMVLPTILTADILMQRLDEIEHPRLTLADATHWGVPPELLVSHETFDVLLGIYPGSLHALRTLYGGQALSCADPFFSR